MGSDWSGLGESGWVSYLSREELELIELERASGWQMALKTRLDRKQSSSCHANRAHLTHSQAINQGMRRAQATGRQVELAVRRFARNCVIKSPAPLQQQIGPTEMNALACYTFPTNFNPDWEMGRAVPWDCVWPGAF